MNRRETIRISTALPIPEMVFPVINQNEQQEQAYPMTFNQQNQEEEKKGQYDE